MFNDTNDNIFDADSFDEYLFDDEDLFLEDSLDAESDEEELMEQPIDPDDRSQYQTTTILAEGESMSNDTWSTRLNNNMLVIGCSGSGKTRNVLLPNLLEMSSSYVVLDTKGDLYRKTGPFLERNGYQVWNLNFADMSKGSSIGYNPFDYIEYDARHHCYSEQDIMSVALALCPIEDKTQPFWEYLTRDLIAVLIGYVMEFLPPEERNIGKVGELAGNLNGGTIKLLDRCQALRPDCFVARHWPQIRTTTGADKMWSSVLGILSEKLGVLEFNSLNELYTMPNRIDFGRLGRERCALFVTISDVDHSLEKLTGLFVYQAMNQLIRSADSYDTYRLPVPVRLFLDDFGNLLIKDIDKDLSVVRSREIWVTILCQSVSQLFDRYGECANSIMSNCDSQLLLACHDDKTAECFASTLDKPKSSILKMPLDRAWLAKRGESGRLVRAFDVTDHPNYEAAMRASAAGFVQHGRGFDKE